MPNDSASVRVGLLELNQTQFILSIAAVILCFDQLTKWVVLRVLGYAQEWVVIEGFFKFVHWVNTGAAWSLFKGQNNILAVISFVALVAMFFGKKHLGSDTLAGRVALGLLFGGITGNLFDRLNENRGHVIDFLYFYTVRRGGTEIGFPAFNVADSAICLGVGTLFWLTYRKERPAPAG